MPVSTRTSGFDGYAATVHAQPEVLFAEMVCLMESAGFEAAVLEGGKARFYAHCRDLVDEKGHRLLQMKWGGSNPHPHLECYGVAAPFVAQHLRDTFSHQPTRIDHAIDLRAKGLFDRIHGYAVALCKEFGLAGSPAGDWVTVDGGRTYYVGSRASQVYVRIYEKGLKYARDLGIPVTDELRDWVRVELEFKPQNKLARGLATKIDGRQMWGSTAWTEKLATEVLGIEAEAVTIRERRESDTERALRFMGSQYAKHLRKLFDQNGGDFEEFGRAIGVLAGFEEADE